MTYQVGSSTLWAGIYEYRGTFTAQWGFCASTAAQEIGTFATLAEAEQALADLTAKWEVA